MAGEINSIPADPAHGIPRDPRPHQTGAAQGTAPGGGLANEAKNWLIDTGATNSCITPANLAHFVPTRSSWTAAQGATGAPVPVQVVEGITMHFQAEDAKGIGQNLSCDLPVLILNADVIGNDQLAHVHVKVDWDAETGTGKLFLKPQPAGG